MARRLAAILVADVVGYSRLMGTDETGTLAAIKKHRKELVEPRARRYDGRMVKLMGDGVLMEFASAVDAVDFAVGVQCATAERNKDVPGKQQIIYRIGINVGDIIIENDDIFGDGVNIAARLEKLADPGGVCISRSAYEQVRDKLGYHFDDCGELAVKNIARPVHVYRFVVEGAPTISSREPVLPSSLGTRRLSIAVLPLANLSGDEDQDYFADAVTEDLTADLSRISGSFVISRSTAASFRGKDVNAMTVAQELKVRYVLEGTVRKTHDKVHVGVQLTDGKTGQQVWSERYEKTVGDMYAFQNEVTGLVARALNLELKDAESRQATRGSAGNLDATDLALRAWAELWTKPQTPATNEAALAYVARALKIDPEHAETNAVAAYAYARAAAYGWGMSRENGIKMGLAAGEKSVAHDPKNADAVYALAFLSFLGGEFRKAQEFLNECISLNRNHAPAYFFYGRNLLRLGRPEDTIAWIERAFALSPRDPLRSVWYAVIAHAHVLTGEDTQAVEAAQKGIAANPDHSHNHAGLASAYAHLGKMEKASAALRDFIKVQPGITVSRYRRDLTSGDVTAVKTYQRLMSGLRMAGLAE